MTPKESATHYFLAAYVNYVSGGHHVATDVYIDLALILATCNLMVDHTPSLA